MRTGAIRRSAIYAFLGVEASDRLVAKGLAVGLGRSWLGRRARARAGLGEAEPGGRQRRVAARSGTALDLLRLSSAVVGLGV